MSAATAQERPLEAALPAAPASERPRYARRVLQPELPGRPAARCYHQGDVVWLGARALGREALVVRCEAHAAEAEDLARFYDPAPGEEPLPAEAWLDPAPWFECLLRRGGGPWRELGLTTRDYAEAVGLAEALLEEEAVWAALGRLAVNHR